MLPDSIQAQPKLKGIIHNMQNVITKSKAQAHEYLMKFILLINIELFNMQGIFPLKMYITPYKHDEVPFQSMALALAMAIWMTIQP